MESTNHFLLLIDTYLESYMYSLEQTLISNKENILHLTFQVDEANTDRPLKEFIKYTILTQNDIICSKMPLSINRQGVHEEINQNIYISNVYLPEELTEAMKKTISTKGVYTQPDICIELKHQNNTAIIPIELKSTKKDVIPGSSIQQINPFEWVIFVKHTNDDVDVSIGRYIDAMCDEISGFPDRSPRPKISFNKLHTYNEVLKNKQKDTLWYNEAMNNPKTTANKIAIITDWQGHVAKEWEKAIKKPAQKKDGWFVRVLRTLALNIIQNYETLSEDERIKYKEGLKNE